MSSLSVICRLCIVYVESCVEKEGAYVEIYLCMHMYILHKHIDI